MQFDQLLKFGQTSVLAGGFERIAKDALGGAAGAALFGQFGKGRGHALVDKIAAQSRLPDAEIPDAALPARYKVIHAAF